MVDADVIIVGFRCAGAPLAHALHRAGVRVIVVEKDRFFTDQPMSTHTIQPFGMKMLDKLGLGDIVRGLAPPSRAFRFQVEESYLQLDLDGRELDSRAPRRSKLDPALQRQVLDAGVDARDRHLVTGLLRDGQRVTGIRVKAGEREYALRAPLVVGADGRNSTIAKLVGAEAYLEAKTGNGLYWSYFEKTPVFANDPRYSWGACIHVEGREARAVFETDSGLLLMAGGGPRELVEGWRGDPTSSLVAHLRRGRLTAPLVDGSRMVMPPVGLLSLHFFMKRAAGAGWALVGDAGLHLDPTAGLGISDALRDADALAGAVVDGSEQAMRVYWRRRDADSIGLYHFASDMGSEDYNNPMTRMIFKRAQNTPAIVHRMRRMMERQVRPQNMVPPTRFIGWLVAESLSGNFAPLAFLGRSARFGRRVVRQQAVLDRALASAERGDPDDTLPSLPQ